MIRFRNMTMAAVPLLLIANAAQAEAVRFEALVAPANEIRLDFADESERFFLLVKREGDTDGTGPLSGASVQEYGVHNVVPGVGGEPRGYLEFATSEGDKAYVEWSLQAIFVPGAEGKPKLLNHGVWKVVGGTGSLKTLQGGGRLHLDFPGSSERLFVLEGDLVQ